MTPTSKEIQGVIDEAIDRYDEGRTKYGELDLATDQRDWIKELEAELLDNINYSIFKILQLRRLSKMGQNSPQ